MGGPPADRAAIAAMGRALGPDVLAAVEDLYRGEQERFAGGQPPTLVDAPYRDDPRQHLDLYSPAGGGPWPVLLWVHGGGFIRGEKRSAATLIMPMSAVGRRGTGCSAR